MFDLKVMRGRVAARGSVFGTSDHDVGCERAVVGGQALWPGPNVFSELGAKRALSVRGETRNGSLKLKLLK